ncbi:MAG: hypothetical protein ACYDBQ_09195 [Thermoplasmatota archaeon]
MEGLGSASRTPDIMHLRHVTNRPSHDVVLSAPAITRLPHWMAFWKPYGTGGDPTRPFPWGRKATSCRTKWSLATVYNHFWSLDELIPARGAFIFESLCRPARADASQIFGASRDVGARFHRWASALGDFYAHGGEHCQVGRFERDPVPAVARLQAKIRSHDEALVRTAVPAASSHAVRAIAAVTDSYCRQARRDWGSSTCTTSSFTIWRAATRACPVLEGRRAKPVNQV